MQKKIIVALAAFIITTGILLAWPYGNIGLGVDSPEAQLDVGGSTFLRGNVFMTWPGAEKPSGFPSIWAAHCENTDIQERFNDVSYTGLFFGNNSLDQYGFLGLADVGCIGTMTLGSFEVRESDFSRGSALRLDAAANRIEFDSGAASIQFKPGVTGFIFRVGSTCWTNKP